MSSTCPNGHASAADDYCDVCGAPIDSTATPAPAAAPAPVAGPAASAPTTVACPHCGTENVPEALFCEACGYDFTTGTLPRADTPPAAETEDTAATTDDATAAGGEMTATTGDFRFVAEIWIDPAWYEAQQSPDQLPSPGLPEVVPLRKSSVLVGRVSRSRNIHPDLDCEPDSGVSRRQAQLTTDGTRWWVEDLESANGTFVAGGTDVLPDSPIPVGLKQEIQPGTRIFVGAWTRIVVREATAEEQESLA